MNPLKEYIISFAGLKPGEHRYDYLIEHSFFGKFEYSRIHEARVWVNVLLTKQQEMFLLDFTITGTVHVSCDRCLEYFDLPVEGTNRLLVHFGEKMEEETDELIILPKSESEINIAQYIYEFISLLVPMRVVHPAGKDGMVLCDPKAAEVLKKLSAKKHGDDPRWNTLKNIKL